jgi:receptor expression-enhancing protein 5/6
VVTSIISLLGGMKLISDLIGFLYPAYMSFKAIESEGTQDDTQWLTYWVVFATFSILEGSVLFVLEYIPFYFVIKTVFMAWLFHPKFMGAALIYKQFK